MVSGGEIWEGKRVKWWNGNEIKREDCMLRYDRKSIPQRGQGTREHMSALCEGVPLMWGT